MRVAIVEDDGEQARRIAEYVDRFARESGEACTSIVFSNGMDFISDYEAKYDLILLDIEMPMMDGMTMAEKLREMDGYVAIIFVTNMAQYAVRGYSVNALDFIVKPVEYSLFAAKMRKASAYIRAHGERFIIVTLPDGMRKLSSRDISYVEVMGHSLIYHTSEGNVETRGQLSVAEKDLTAPNFARCNKCYLVNLDHVTAVKQDSVVVGKDELTVSRRRRKEFYKLLADRLGGGAGGG